jgi:hypothetical protein
VKRNEGSLREMGRIIKCTNIPYLLRISLVNRMPGGEERRGEKEMPENNDYTSQVH